MILVTGPAGRVGSELLPRLATLDAPVRVLSRRPERARVPDWVEVVAGDLSDVGSLGDALRGVDQVFLFSAGHAGAGIAKALAEAGVRRLVVISGIAQDPAEVERELTDADLDWTHLWPTAFASNAARHWGQSIKHERVVRTPYGNAEIAPIHDADIAAVAATVLTEDGHGGRRYELTGPESLTFREQVAVISRVLGAEIAFREEEPAEARERMLASYIPEAVVEALLAVWQAATAQPAPVTDAVRDVTGQEPRAFASWVAEHLDVFR